MSTGIVCGGLLALCVSCTEYTPKPRGYFRIDRLPLPTSTSGRGFTLYFPAFQMGRGGVASGRESGRVDQSLLSAVEREALLQLFPYHSGYAGQGGGGVSRVGCPAIEISGTDQDAGVQQSGGFGLWFAFHAGCESASPLQFMLTDSVSHFFRGALYYDCIPNADSLAPVTRYLKQDI